LQYNFAAWKPGFKLLDTTVLGIEVQGLFKKCGCHARSVKIVVECLHRVSKCLYFSRGKVFVLKMSGN
jgi:hypothetical protein